MIEVKNLSYIVTDKETGETKVVLDDLSLSFPKGKITVVTGHNGSGKSTLVKLIMGINTTTSGQVFFDGKDITKMSITERAKLGLTMAFQQPVRFKGLFVKDLLFIAGYTPSWVIWQNPAVQAFWAWACLCVGLAKKFLWFLSKK